MLVDHKLLLLGLLQSLRQEQLTSWSCRRHGQGLGLLLEFSWLLMSSNCLSSSSFFLGMELFLRADDLHLGLQCLLPQTGEDILLQSQTISISSGLEFLRESSFDCII